MGLQVKDCCDLGQGGAYDITDWQGATSLLKTYVYLPIHIRTTAHQT